MAPRTSANLAAVMLARRELRLLRVLHSFCCSGHLVSSSWLLASSNPFVANFRLTSAIRPLTSDLRSKRHPQMLQQRPRLIVGPCCRHNGHVHSLQLVHLGVINLRRSEEHTSELQSLRHLVC